MYSPIELKNPHAEFRHFHYPYITRAALDGDGNVTGDLELIAPIELLVRINAQALAPSAKRFLTNRGMIYRANPRAIRVLEKEIRQCYSRSK
ncbi:MAG: hypothetical protein OCU12_06280 [Methanophagales archaeon]|nr:hypothetical protein [Methanophagales archaeon]